MKCEKIYTIVTIFFDIPVEYVRYFRHRYQCASLLTMVKNLYLRMQI